MIKTIPSTVSGELTESVHIYLSDSRGQYIPRDFARDTKRECISGVKPEDLDYLARGPGGVCDEDTTLTEGETERGEFYWETWETVCDNAIVTCPISGRKFRLHQDGDLFLVPCEWEWDEASNGFRPPESDTLRRYVLPVYWASALINGDESGIDADEVKAIADFIAKEGLQAWTCADVGEQYFSHHNDAGTMAGDVAEYTFVLIK